MIVWCSATIMLAQQSTHRGGAIRSCHTSLPFTGRCSSCTSVIHLLPHTTNSLCSAQASLHHCPQECSTVYSLRLSQRVQPRCMKTADAHTHFQSARLSQASSGTTYPLELSSSMMCCSPVGSKSQDFGTSTVHCSDLVCSHIVTTFTDCQLATAMVENTCPAGWQ